MTTQSTPAMVAEMKTEVVASAIGSSRSQLAAQIDRTKAVSVRTMKSTAIFLPALALMLWTLLVLVQVPIRRFTAYFRKRVGPLDFQCGESSNVPADVALPNRIFMNLLEVPVLFYALAFIAFSTNQVNPVSVGLAWLYVALRVVHSLIYFTYNHVVHRFAVFAISNLVVLAMIVYLGKALL